MQNLSNLKPRELAEKVLERFSVKTAPVPVEKIARELKAQVRFAPLDEELSGMIHIKDGVAIIGVNSLHHPNRQRFTIAHELGHLEMHKDLITSTVHVDKEFPALMRDENSTKGEDRIEIQANQFASELLMPKPLIEKELAGKQFDIDDDGPLEQIAKKFRVSKQALQLRIRSLNI